MSACRLHRDSNLQHSIAGQLWRGRNVHRGMLAAAASKGICLNQGPVVGGGGGGGGC